jgi:hypothetical protein
VHAHSIQKIALCFLFSFCLAGVCSASDTIGVTNGADWYLDTNGNGIWNDGDAHYTFGSTGWTPVTGDWNGDGRCKAGVYNNGEWYLDYDGSQAITVPAKKSVTARDPAIN